MKVLDAGHRYELDVLDGKGGQIIQFVKREGEGYPFNQGSCPGVICQEVLRVLIDRTKYLNRQIPCQENTIIINSLRDALSAFELRAARRHERELLESTVEIELRAYCQVCGHIGCKDHK